MRRLVICDCRRLMGWYMVVGDIEGDEIAPEVLLFFPISNRSNIDGFEWGPN